MSHDGYIQGAGDDSESWAYGLTAPLFWENKKTLMNTPEENLPDLISSFLENEKNVTGISKAAPIKPTDWLLAATFDVLNSTEVSNSDLLITCGEASRVAQTPANKPKHLHLECRTGKLGSRDLRLELSKITTLLENSRSFTKIYVSCLTGKDLSIGVILVILCLYTTDDGKQPSSQYIFDTSSNSSCLGKLSMLTQSHTSPTKTFIKQRLSWIMTAYPAASPSRATLQSVNDFLFKFPHTNIAPQITNRSLFENSHSSSVPTLFHSLVGTWNMYRKITNFHSQGFAGDVTGTALFQERAPSASGADSEYLYIESGTFKTTSGAEFQASRRWIWRLSDNSVDSEGNGPVSTPQIVSIHFVKLDGVTEDYLYNELEFNRDSIEEEENMMVARADHPCGEDFYKSVYKMSLASLGDVEVRKFEVEHQVKGPSKDYTSTTWYTRGPSPGKNM
jgi:tRNA A64-2'-O-ribosylphosphate transferase